jgi:hypothetical protein
MRRLKLALGIAWTTLREIFDENAYARFLAFRQIDSSVQAYSEFCRERESRTSRRPRCC